MNPALRPPRRLRWTRRIAGAAALIAGLIWPLTYLGDVTLILSLKFRVAFFGGGFNLQFNPVDGSPPGIYTFGNPGGVWYWWPQWYRMYTLPGGGGGTTITNIIIPIWIIAAAFGAVALFASWKCRVWKLGHCRKCGYDLTATTATSPCPECGRVGTRIA